MKATLSYNTPSRVRAAANVTKRIQRTDPILGGIAQTIISVMDE